MPHAMCSCGGSIRPSGAGRRWPAQNRSDAQAQFRGLGCCLQTGQQYLEVFRWYSGREPRPARLSATLPLVFRPSR